jgi:phospholipid transport system substrate-binding protein
MKRTVLVRRFVLAMALSTLFLSSPVFAAASSAQDAVRGFYATLVSTMKDGPQLGFDGRYKKLDPAIRAAFDLPSMARLSVGASWSTASEKEKTDLVDAFSRFSIATYASRFAAYDGEEFAVTGEKTAGKDVIVETSLTPKDGEAVTLNYLMRADAKGQFRIVDVFMNGMISELATRRSEFSSITRREGVPALVNSLGEKAKQMSAS